MLIKFKKLKNRLLVYFCLAVSLLLLTVSFAFDIANTKNAKFMISNALQVTVNALEDQLYIRTQHLTEATRLLSGDFAFKQAFFTQDNSTILSAMKNHQNRINADLMILANLRGETIASTIPVDQQQLYNSIITEAENSESGHAEGLIYLNGMLYQVVAVPLLAPIPKGWFLVGFHIDETFLDRLKKITMADISFISQNPHEKAHIYKSSLTEDFQMQINRQLDVILANHQTQLSLLKEQHLMQYIKLEESDFLNVYVLVQRSLSTALEPFKKIRQTLLFIGLTMLALSMIMINAISRSIVRPVNQLADSARQIQEGNYQGEVAITQFDEIGKLQASFGHMMQGLRERDRVRNLLGKVVSEEIAEELLSHEIELGGEEKKASVLFSDIRNFTALSEQYSPKELLEILNQYLTCMSEAIESHGGVIDKYIGDAIMALFGAPITSPNSANLCVRAALAMQKSLSTLNKHFSDRHWPQLAMGIGINTSVVIAGNMGSKNRLNYTVIGDGVNLASRVEGLCKYYGVNIIVTQSTASEAKDFLHRELDRVRVKGKSESVSIYEPIQINSLSDRVQFDKYHNALKLYRQQQWDDAFREFSRLDRKSPQPLFKLYLSRIALFKHQPPEQDWDGTYVFKTK